MSKLLRSFSWKSAIAVLLLATGTTAHAQVLRDRYLGGTTGDYCGGACANAGDVDDDGTDDYIVSSFGFKSGSLYLAGRIVIYSGATGVMIRAHDGLFAGDYFGFSVAGAGDVDGDGFPDYVVGAPFHNNVVLDVGLVVVYSGQTGAELWSKIGSAFIDVFGVSVSGIGDVNGDGKSDVIVGSLNDEIFVLDDVGNTIHHLTGSDYFGYSVAGCGDLDGDGVNDFLVGQPNYDQPVPALQDVGAVLAYSGSSGLLIHTSTGTNAGDQLGRTVAKLGDVDQDGVDDYISGSAISTANGLDSGIVRVISGATGATIREQTGDTASEYHGFSVCGMGDTNRDGVPDYAVGATKAGNGGRVRICSGSDGATIYEWLGIAGSNVELGSAVASGDWNSDGVADLLSGDDYFIDSGNIAGCADVHLLCPAWSTSYGAGWPGTNGIPSLSCVQDPEVGAQVDVQIGNSRGAATTALLFIGLLPANVPLPGNGTFLVAPLFSLVLPVPPAGLTLSDTLPNDPAIYFLDVYLQALELDPAATKGLSFTPGLQLHCGYDLP